MSSIVTRITPVLDGAPQKLGDGVPRLRTISIESGYALPVFLRVDSDVLQTYRFDVLPATVVLRAGKIELLSGNPNPVPLPDPVPAPPPDPDEPPPPPPDPQPPTTGRSFFVSPTGSAGGTGGIDSPWTLAYAIAGAGGVLQPGDTVWLRAGSYVGTFAPACPDGLPTARITFRQLGGDAPLGERAKIDGEWKHTRKYVDLRGIEVTQTDPNATGISGVINGDGTEQAEGVRTINCVLHDLGETGATGWLQSRGPSAIYGCISYNNGTHFNLDHGYYIHDQEKLIELCVAFNNLARGFQAYDSARDQKHTTFRKCISFNNGEISTVVDGDTNFLARVLPPRLSEDVTFEDCVGFHSTSLGSKRRQLRLGTDGNGPGQKDVYVRRCYFWRGRTFIEINQWKQLTYEDNVMVAEPSVSTLLILRDAPSESVVWERNKWYLDPGLVKWQYKSLRYNFADWQAKTGLGGTDTAQAGTPPTRYFLWPNEFEPGRGHLAIFNHNLLPSVPVNLGIVMPVGSKFEIRNMQDLWGTPVVKGTYDGDLVQVPMNVGVPAPTPLGASRVFSVPPRTAPEFDAFLVLKV